MDLNRVVVLYRLGVDPDEQYAELGHIQDAGFRVYTSRVDIPSGTIVIGRYSVLPFYQELDFDICRRGSTLINSFREHCFIADMKQWVEILGELTPKLYPRLEDLPEVGPFVLKGQTNSRKFEWNTSMFAWSKREAGAVWSRLTSDSLIGQQTIYARNFVPLKQMRFKNGELATDGGGCPVSEEYRFFVFNGKVVGSGFYWASHAADLAEVPTPPPEANKFVAKVIDTIGSKAGGFYVIDVARTAAGGWTVVELNDGQMSGYSLVDPKEMWKNIAIEVAKMA